jgi:hypothetical protein
MRTICVLRSRADWGKRSAMNSPSSSAGAHHRELHRARKESDWWSRNGLEPLESARNLWTMTYPIDPHG